MPAKRIQEYISRHRVTFELIRHTPAYTAPEVAQSAHVQGSFLLKSVIAKVDDALIMVAIPAHAQLSLEALAEALRAQRVELAGERDFQGAFGDCETGALPPIGRLFGVPTYVCAEFEDDDKVAFCAGTHSELLTLRWADFLKLAGPRRLKGVALMPGFTPPKMSYRRGRLRL